MAEEGTPLIGSGEEKGEDSAQCLPPVQNNDITLSRRLARYLSQYKWYNPAQHGVSSIEIDKAWDYFEHVTLARYEVPDRSESQRRDCYHKADVGEKEKPTRLYPYWSTPETDLGDFGIGVGIYFFTLRILAVIMFIAGLINIPNITYYSGDQYNQQNERNLAYWALENSAICSHQTWVACPTCTKKQWDSFPATYTRYGEVETDDGSLLTFIKRNHCVITGKVGMVGYISVAFVCVAIFLLQKFIKRHERHLDLSAQTASDYTVEISNPPHDAKDVDEWKTFFEASFGHVACVTVVLDNEELIRALISRRQLVHTLERLQPPNIEVDPHDIASAVALVPEMAWYEKFLFGDAETIEKQIAALDEKITNDLSKRDCPVSEVFVTFEAELSQKQALLEMCCRGIDVLNNNTSAVDDKYLFRGERLLAVSKPPEPSSVRWQDLDETRLMRIKQQLVTGALTVVIIVLGCFLITYTSYRYGSVYAAIMVTVVNSLAPMVCRFITEYESHRSEGSKQASLYCKITACIWIFTAIITAVITPFVDTLQDDKDSLIPAMFAIFITEMLKAPVKQVLDISGNIKRHVLGPRAWDQKRINYWFQGTPYQLSERYTDMTNVMFLTFCYGLIFPAGFFYGSATLAVHYFADKFCLLRNWAPAPLLNSKIADLSRDYFFTAAVAVYAIISAFNFASFPFDKACEDNGTVSSPYIGVFGGVDGEGNPFTVTVSANDKNWYYCDQDLIRYWPPAFFAVLKPHLSGMPWMNPEQERASWIYGWISFGVCVALLIKLIDIHRNRVKSLLFTKHEGDSDERRALSDRIVTEVHENFSSIPSISAYVPQARIPGYHYPVLLCPVTGIDLELIGWDAPNDEFDKYNVIFDVPGLASNEDIFSRVQHWHTMEKE